MSGYRSRRSAAGLARPARHSLPNPGRNVALTSIVLVLTLLAGTIWVMVDRRAADIAAADRETASLATVLAEQTSRSFGAADFVLRDLLERIRAAGIDTQEALASGVGTPEIQRVLQDEITGLGQIDVAAIVGADGRLINFSRQWPVPETSFVDRPYFRALRDDPSLGLLISEPIPGRPSGNLTISLARRIEAPDGRFLGIVVGAIKLDYFADLYRSVSEGDGRFVALRRHDGTLLARYPETDHQPGAIPVTDDLFRPIRQGAQFARSLSPSPTDGTRRLRVAQAVADFPLVVVVGRSEAAILADWRRQAGAIGAGSVLAAAALTVAMGLLARQMARRETSEATLAATLDNVSQGIVMIAPDHHVAVCNPRAIEMLGLPPDLMATRPHVDEVLRWQQANGEFGEDCAAVDPATRLVLRAGGASPEVHTCERRRPDGTVLEVSSIPLADGGAVRTFTDVTVARQREAALQAALCARDKAEAALPQQRDAMERELAERTQPLVASEARHRDVAEVASDWIWETDADHRLTFVSKRFGDTSGIAWAEVAGRTLDDLVALGFDPHGMDDLRATIDARGTFHDIVYRIAPAGGAERFWRMGGRPFTDPASGAFAGYRGMGTDVTAMMQHEAALNEAVRRAEAAEQEAQRARTRLADAIEAIPEGVVLHDAEDRLVLCNTRYGEIYHLGAEAMTPGARFEDALRATVRRGDHNLEGRDAETVIAERLARHRRGAGNSEEHRLADGRCLKVVERRTSDGGIVGIRVDVTLQRRQEAAERDRAKLAALGQLAGGVAHEINNLLQPAITFPELVRERLPPDDIESRLDLDCVLESARKVREIVRNILLFARKEEPRLVPLDLAAEIRLALAFVRDLMPPSLIVREENLGAYLGFRVAANKTQLTQVLTNLLVNAAQAMQQTGTVTVTIERVDPTPKEAAALTVEPGRGYLAVSVADNGCGMDAETQARIFEPFFTTKPVGQGTGLGLSVAYGILRSWQGVITVKSAPDEGTAFILYVPTITDATG